ncbi:MAG: TSCPD domain-containing protein [Candidatus Heimdallarchaeota archaeon]
MFEIEEDVGKTIIRNLTIEGKKGCIGHNKSMSILIRDKKAEDIPIDELKEAGCRRASSCTQELAVMLQEILDKKTSD